MANVNDLRAFVGVAAARSFREAARRHGGSPSGLSEAVRRLEEQLGIRLLNRSTRSVVPTEAGIRLFERLAPALAEVEAALDVVDRYRDRPAGTLRLNVPVSAVRTVLPTIVPGFLATYPDIALEIVADDSFVDVVAAGCDAGIRYGERLQPDMVAVPIGSRVQRYATAASPDYLARRGRPEHPRDLMEHDCLRGQFESGAMAVWEFERGTEALRLEPCGPLLVRVGAATDLAVAAAIAGVGVIQLFEDWLRPHLDSGALEPVLRDWWPSFSGPFLYFPGRRLVPPPLRAFVEHVKAAGAGQV